MDQQILVYPGLLVVGQQLTAMAGMENTGNVGTGDVHKFVPAEFALGAEIRINAQIRGADRGGTGLGRHKALREHTPDGFQRADARAAQSDDQQGTGSFLTRSMEASVNASRSIRSTGVPGRRSWEAPALPPCLCTADQKSGVLSEELPGFMDVEEKPNPPP